MTITKIEFARAQVLAQGGHSPIAPELLDKMDRLDGEQDGKLGLYLSDTDLYTPGGEITVDALTSRLLTLQRQQDALAKTMAQRSAYRLTPLKEEAPPPNSAQQLQGAIDDCYELLTWMLSPKTRL